MKHAILALALAAGALGLPASAGGALPELPSGLEPELIEEFIEIKPDGLFTYARFRFLALEIGGAEAPDYEALADDFMTLCRGYALARLAGNAEPIDRIVISYSDRPLGFGEADPEAVQFFEQFTLENGDCQWEQF